MEKNESQKAEIERFYKKESNKNKLSDDLLDQKIIDILKEHSKIKEKNKKHIESYKPQVNPSEINFFKITPNGRKRIRIKNNAISVDDEKEYSTEELINQIESNPERFSPNVLMRPLFQEKILPNICYVGGPNELKYWMQLKLFFDNSNLQYPILKLRSSAFIIDQKTSLKIKKEIENKQNAIEKIL